MAGKEAYLVACRKGFGPTETARAVIEAYLRVPVPPETIEDWRLSPITRACAKLEPGQFVDVAGQPIQAIRARFHTARRLLGRPNAVFICESLSSGKVRVRRLEDGVRYHRNPWLNPKAVELASLKPGESKIAESLKTVRGKGSMGGNAKVAARKLLDNFRADWTVRMTTRGVRLTRLEDRVVDTGSTSTGRVA